MCLIAKWLPIGQPICHEDGQEFDGVQEKHEEKSLSDFRSGSAKLWFENIVVCYSR